MLLVYLSVAWIVGIFLGRLLWDQGVISCDWPALWIWGASAILLLVAAILLRRRKSVRLALVLLLFALLGAWRYQSHPLDPCFAPSDLAFHNGNEEEPVWAAVEGIVADYPDVGEVGTNYELRVRALEKVGTRREVVGTALLRAPLYPEYHYGDEVRVSGLLERPPCYDDFCDREHLARRSIHSLIRYPRGIELLAQKQGNSCRAALHSIRGHLSHTINRMLPEPAAALLNGILLGIESGIPPELYEDFNATGTSHIIVISGFNITIVAGLLTHTLGRLVGKRRTIYPVVGGILLYTLLVGGDAAVMRAAIMGILYVTAIHLGRQSTAFVSLSFSALVMTAANPLSLWDVGFLLSFASTLGMILFTPVIQTWLQRMLGRWLQPAQLQPVMRFLNDALISTLAAQILTLPLVAATFGRLSLISLLSNLLILPVQPLVMISGTIATLAGLLWLPLGRVAAAVVWLFLSYTAAVVEWTARLPFASVHVGELGRPLAVLFYAALFGWIALRQLRRRLEIRTTLPTRRAVAVALVAAIPLWASAAALSSLPDGRLHVWFVGLGDSDAALVQTPSGRRVLVDVGRGEGDLAGAVAAFLPGWSRRIDLLVLTQADQANMDAASDLLDRYRVIRALLPRGTPVLVEETDSSVSSALPLTTVLRTGVHVPLDEGVLLEVLHAPGEPGAGGSAVLRLTMGDLRLLLPSEMEQETQADLLAGSVDLFSTVLKTPHAGTGNWPTTELLHAARPQSIFVPDDVTYPPDVQEQLRALPMLAVDPLETVQVISDGRQLWIRRHRPTGRSRR
jgi:competence protein ComEC